MRSLRKVLLTSALAFAALVTAQTADAQTARLQFDNLNYLNDRATEVVEVNVEGKMLELAKRVLVKVNDADAQKVGEAIKGLEGIYVRVFRFDQDNQYNISDVEVIRSQLQTPGWEKLANVRSKKKNQKIDVYTMFEGQDISGVAVILSEDRTIALVNVIGPVDIDTLVEISGKINIPKFDIETVDDDGTN
ncbi:MAG: DUF4252 domain-containing protein [Acidobacteria bacterium]|nr:MAG: DUF4252 domain-containing protein [Acidobacteriota bacterium]REK02605.1 MAG: DUF4252 domain-containing protein [Acidobacteriota bacterium]REK13592.1 MAG: DUF4252 domain-containing protein [Acidobacteriota bacterium]REK41586.1 MAG: DUF4252 domain-containing protein [Acidobacteriota bacterium]